MLWSWKRVDRSAAGWDGLPRAHCVKAILPGENLRTLRVAAREAAPATERGSRMRGDLEQRVKAVLLAIVDNFIQTGEPIGSRTISKVVDLGLSAATIRNVMADLTEQGYL